MASLIGVSSKLETPRNRRRDAAACRTGGGGGGVTLSAPTCRPVPSSLCFAEMSSLTSPEYLQAISAQIRNEESGMFD